MKEKQDPGENSPVDGDYPCGYNASSDRMATRTASVEAAFFLPHLSVGMSLLDGGCGPGTITIGPAGYVDPGTVTGFDVSEAEIAKARANADQSGITNVECVVADAYDLPFEDDTFDAVWSSAMIEHLPDRKWALLEFKRVLKPGGVIGLRASDYRGMLISPRDTYDEITTRMLELSDLNGGDSYIGRDQPRLLRECGFVDRTFTASYEIPKVASIAAVTQEILLSDATTAVFETAGKATRS